jgi:MCP family monocarboxylic acid transporter-like MFS transporter 10
MISIAIRQPYIVLRLTLTRVQALYIFSGISCSGAFLALSFIRSGSLAQIFLVQGVLLGFANAAGSQPALVVVSQHFVRRRALVMGIVAAAGSVGGVCFPALLAKLADEKQVGYAWSLRVVAGIIVYVDPSYRGCIRLI